MFIVKEDFKECRVAVSNVKRQMAFLMVYIDSHGNP